MSRCSLLVEFALAALKIALNGWNLLYLFVMGGRRLNCGPLIANPLHILRPGLSGHDGRRRFSLGWRSTSRCGRSSNYDLSFCFRYESHLERVDRCFDFR
jgi:hypothetical protein